MPEYIIADFGKVSGDSPGNNGMAQAMREFDWASTSAGAIAQWADPLQHAARLVLLSPAPTALLIGRDALVAHNDAVRDLFGPSYDGSLGKPVAEVLPETVPFYREVLDRCFSGVGCEFSDRPLRVNRDGNWSVAWFHLVFTPVADAEGRVSGVLLVLSETTARVLASRELERSRERIDIALEAGGIVGTWDWDIAADQMTCDERFAQFFTANVPGAFRGMSSGGVMELVHPDDRAVARDLLAQAVRTGGDYRCRLRMVMVNGEIRSFYAAGRAVRDEDGVVTKLCGVVIDLTKRIAAEDALADSEQRFHVLVEAIPQIVWSTDPQGRHDYFNSRWNEFTGLDAAKVDGATWESLVHPEDWPRVAEQWKESIATGKPYDIEYRFLHHSGQYRWLRVMALPVRGSDGEIMRWHGTSTDIEESKVVEMERELVANELEHRIRNLFALVNGLVALSLREDPGFAPFADRLRQRLSSLHRAHEFIRGRAPVQDKARSIQALARAILAPYDDGGRIEVEGDDAVLRDNLVTPLALIFHELATNSAKYGALTRDGGSLSLRFQRGSGRIRLAWVERGGAPPPPEIADGGGFGSKLLALTIERQLKGSFCRTFTAAGLTFEMIIPS
jgi:PAS domain S-box-containing protein